FAFIFQLLKIDCSRLSDLRFIQSCLFIPWRTYPPAATTDCQYTTFKLFLTNTSLESPHRYSCQLVICTLSFLCARKQNIPFFQLGDTRINVIDDQAWIGMRICRISTKYPEKISYI